MMRDEAPPNKEVHADDLAVALEKLHACSDTHQEQEAQRREGRVGRGERVLEGGRVVLPDRRRSSVLVYHPQDHGSNLALPVVMVEDMTEGDEAMREEVAIMAHTARPPIELMDLS